MDTYIWVIDVRNNIFFTFYSALNTPIKSIKQNNTSQTLIVWRRERR